MQSRCYCAQSFNHAQFYRAFGLCEWPTRIITEIMQRNFTKQQIVINY